MSGKTIHQVTYILVILGGIDLGLMGLFNFSLFNLVFGAWPVVIKVLYILIGISAVYDIALMHKGYCMYCSGKKK